MTQTEIDRLAEQTAGMLQALGEGRPATIEEVAATAGLPAATVAARLGAEQQVELDRAGRVLGVGLTLLPTGHRIDLAGRGYALYGWCAPDVLVVPWLLGVPGRVSSRCPATGTPITAYVGPEGVGEVQPRGRWCRWLPRSMRPTSAAAPASGSTCSPPARPPPAGWASTRPGPSRRLDPPQVAAQAAQGATTMAFVVLWLLGGSFTPPANLPDALAAVAKALPSYGVVQVGWSAASHDVVPASAVAVLAA
ncbi:MAG TPA: organomercurial lyase [Actinomycetes bacterium]|nr:organomercurial lyase [Actinomycetes bacterium]